MPNNTNKCRIGLAEKLPLKELVTPKRHCKEEPLAYVSKYNKNNPELFTEMKKNLEQLKNNERIKNIQHTTKIIKAIDNPEI